MTHYHSQYWAHALTLRGSGGGIAALSRSIANARVDLNPHQIDAAMSALRSPFTNGAILADEVGLGKTVEAGIVLSQKWAERRRRNGKRRELFDAQDAIDHQREDLIGKIEKQLKHTSSTQVLFAIRWGGDSE
jgi:SNF2 family DNA or RNA helicase